MPAGVPWPLLLILVPMVAYKSVITQYLTTVKLMHEQFVEPSKKNADIIIQEGGYNVVALQMLNERIKALL